MSEVISEEIEQVRLLSENNAGRNCNVCGDDAIAYLSTESVSTYFVCEEHLNDARAGNKP
jgi:hypothetical protein